MADEELDVEETATLIALLDAQARMRRRVQANVSDVILRLLGDLSGHWYDAAAVAAVADQAADIVRTGQEAVADGTAEYLDQILLLQGAIPDLGSVHLPSPLRAVDPLDQWERPARQYRRLVSEGLAEVDAHVQAELRAEQMAVMDLNLAMRESSRQRLAPVDKILGYRRILRPELSEGGVCGLCIVASDRVYKRGDLLPLHGGCNCDVLPIVFGKGDPGHQLNAADLADLYEAAGGTHRSGLQRVRVRVMEHGELGPVLVDAKHNNRDAAEAAVDSAASQRQLERAQERLIALLERQAAGEDVSGPVTYHQKLIAHMQQLVVASAA